MTTDYSKTSTEKVKQQKKVVQMEEKKVKQDNKTEDRKKLSSVTHAKKQKPSLGKRMSNAFFGPDGLPSVGHYLTQDVLVPAIKDLIVSAVQNGITAMVYGKDGVVPGNHTTNYSRNYSTGTYRPNRTNYSNSYNKPTTSGVSANPYRKESRAGSFNSEDYILEDRAEAMDVLAQLQDQIENYGWASLADFFDLVGIDTNYTDNNYGWTDLHMSNVSVARGGYSLRLPRLEPLKG